MVTVLKQNQTNNLYVRMLYATDYSIGRKSYSYFTFFPEMAENNHTGLEIATNPELIRKYIPDWMF
jgi:hypothetical protein